MAGSREIRAVDRGVADPRIERAAGRKMLPIEEKGDGSGGSGSARAPESVSRRERYLGGFDVGQELFDGPAQVVRLL